jgi:hypothetical protein
MGRPELVLPDRKHAPKQSLGLVATILLGRKTCQPVQVFCNQEVVCAEPAFSDRKREGVQLDRLREVAAVGDRHGKLGGRARDF